MIYDDRGRVISDHRGHVLSYNSLDLLTTVKMPSGDRIGYRYDHLGRLAARYYHLGREESAGPTMNVTQYFYALPERPYLLSHAFRPAQGSLVCNVFFNLL